MTEMFCREHGMFHDSEQSDPDCVFEDGLGNAVESDAPYREQAR